MKAFAVILLCAFAAVQGRSSGVSSVRSTPALGENPWLVHLRIAVSTSGLLDSCAGALIDNSWILTAASCLNTARFVWTRYGVVDVINPSLVTESGEAPLRVHPEYNAVSGANNIALISINRYVEATDFIAPAPLSSSNEIPASTKFCGFGASESGGPGETLACWEVSLSASEDGLIALSSDNEITEFDIGAPVVSDGEVLGVVASVVEGGATVLPVSSYVDWIAEVTGLSLRSAAAPEVEKVDTVRFVD